MESKTGRTSSASIWFAKMSFENSMAVSDLAMEKSRHQYNLFPSMRTIFMTNSNILDSPLARDSQLVTSKNFDELHVLGVVLIEPKFLVNGLNHMNIPYD
jgi:hypothetical protein